MSVEAVEPAAPAPAPVSAPPTPEPKEGPRVRLVMWGDRCRVWPAGFMDDEMYERFKSAAAGCRVDTEKSKRSGKVFKRRLCSFDRLPGIVKRLRLAGFDVWAHPEVQARLEKHEASQWADLEQARERLSGIDDELRKRGERLFDYQRLGIEWLATRTGALLADEQGLGKTCQVLCALPSAARVLVICPASVKGVWANPRVSETTRWRPGFRQEILDGRGSFRWPEEGEVVAINFDVLPRVHTDACPRVFEKKCDGCVPGERGVHRTDCERGKTYCKGCLPLPECPEGVTVVVDEAHQAKNAKSFRGEAVKAICHAARSRAGRAWEITGTPMQNDPSELWAVLDAADLAYEAFGSRADFKSMFRAEDNLVERFVPGKGRVTQAFGSKWGVPTEEAAERLQRVMLRRMKDDVASELPEKRFRTIEVDVDDAAIAACEKAIGELGGETSLARLLVDLKKVPFELVSTVRQLLAQAKTPALLRLLDDALEAGERKLIVFSAHRYPIDKIGSQKGWVRVTGDMTAKQKTESVRLFQEGDAIGIAGTIDSMGAGVTLTKGSHVFFADLDWNPANNAQAYDRPHRHGQKNTVQYEILVAKHALDRRLAEVLATKEARIRASVDAARDTGAK